MVVRMSDTGPLTAEPTVAESDLSAPVVRVLLTLVPDTDLEAAFAVVDRQVYDPKPEIHVVGEAGEDEFPDSFVHHDNLEAAIADTDSDIDYLWLLHADARPRPDALSALVSEMERNEASLGGSKLLKAGTFDELESVGGATDVFGEPYSGLDEGEIDLQQYDVVREVAFVRSASMLVRRDLARGLRGLDPLLPPVAAGLDFSQRTRLAGGRVITVPSSEVYHQGRCDERGRGWREQAGRLRAMLTAYSPLTLLWLIPYDLLVALADSIGSLLLLRWKPLVRHGYAVGWNLFHLPSTIGQRRRFKKVRSTGDEELFRFQAKGSVRLRAVGEELSNRFLALFDDDQVLARGSERVWRSPGIWGAIVGVIVVVLSVRGLVFGDMPNTGYVFPLEPPTTALNRWFSGWNESGLGSAAAVHPAVGLAGLVSWLWFGAEGAARTLLTIAAGFVGVIGMGRLAGTLGLRGPGRYLSGIVLMAGPGLASLLAHGSWFALLGAAFLPWAVRAVFVHPTDRSTLLTRSSWALALTLVVASFSPVLAVVPLVVVAVWSISRGPGASLILGLVAVAGGVAGLAFVGSDPGWLFDSDRRIGSDFSWLWVAFIGLASLAIFIRPGLQRRVGVIGGLLALGSLSVLKLDVYGPGIEEAVAITASFGGALVVTAALDNLSAKGLRPIAAAGGLAMLVLAGSTMANGRLGLPNEDVNSRMGFAVSLAGESGPGRILHASLDRSLIPGETRSGPGFWYRVLDGEGTTQDEVFLPDELPGDVALAEAVMDIAMGADLRPGARLAEFSIDWVVLEGPSFRLDDVLSTQLDLVPTPVDRSARVFQNLGSVPLADAGPTIWTRDGAGFSGDPVDNVRLAVNHDSGWSPSSEVDGWAVVVDGNLGLASFVSGVATKLWPALTIVLSLVALGAIAIGRRRS